MLLTGFATFGLASAVIMSGAPVEKAGSAAAIEETSYEIGGAFGVAVLGCLGTALYRAELPSGTSDTARESLSGALEAARSLGSPALAEQARLAFSTSLEVTGLYGGLFMLAAALLIWRLTPARLDLAAAHH